MNSKTIVDAWERRVGPVTAHLVTDTHLRKENLFASFEVVCSSVDFSDKTIIDYGCGGGFFGLYLSNKFIVKKYIAYDLAQRSLDVAKKNLEFLPENMKEFIKVDPWNIPQMHADIFCCFSVIHHMPTQTYLDYFLAMLDVSNIKVILLTCKYSAVESFQIHPYKTTKEINNACLTNASEIARRLRHFKLMRYTDAEPGKYQYMRFEHA